MAAGGILIRSRATRVRHHTVSARRYVESDRSGADEYYLGADEAIAEYAVLDATGEVTAARSLSAAEYEAWVDWINPETGEQMGTPRQPGEGRKGSPLFVEMTINAPKSPSVAAALHPEVSTAIDATICLVSALIRHDLAEQISPRHCAPAGPSLPRYRIVAENQGIYVEDLYVKALSWSRAAKSVQDAAFGTFLARLESKAQRAGRTFAAVTRYFPSTRLCSACGALTGPKGLDGLKFRRWACGYGAVHDWGVTAEINIRREGQRLVAAGQADT